MKSFINKINANRPLAFFNVLLLFILVNSVGARLNVRLDLSSGQINSLSASTAQVLEKIEDRILIEAYISQDLPGQVLTLLQPILSQLREIERLGGDRIQYRLINPDTEEERQEAARRGIEGIPISVSKVSESTVRLSYFGVFLQIGEKSAIIPLLGDGQQSQAIVIEDFEYRFLREVKRLGRQGDLSEIAFARAPGLFENRQPTREDGFEKDSIFVYRYLLEEERGSIRDLDLNRPIPEQITTLIMVGQPHLDEVEIYNLDQFLLRGGNLICMVNGFNFNLQNPAPYNRFRGMGGAAFATASAEQVKDLNDWLENYGVTLKSEIIFEFDQATPTFDLDGMYLDRFRNPVWGLYTRQEGNIQGDHPALRDLEAVVLPWFSGLELKSEQQPEVEFNTLLRSSSGAVSKNSASFNVKALHNMEPDSESERAGADGYTLAVQGAGSFKSSFSPNTLPEGVNRKVFREKQLSGTTGRLVVIGTPYLVSDILLQRQGNAEIFRYNQIFLSNLIEAISGDDELLAARSRIKVTSYLERTDEKFEALFRWFHILFLPLVITVYGALRLWRRNRRLGIEPPATAQSSLKGDVTDE